VWTSYGRQCTPSRRKVARDETSGSLIPSCFPTPFFSSSRQARSAPHAAAIGHINSGLVRWTGLGTATPVAPQGLRGSIPWHASYKVARNEQGITNLPDAHPRYALRSRAGCRGDRGLSATAPAYQPSSRVWNSSQLPHNQQRIHLVEVRYCEDTRLRSQLEAAHHQHSVLRQHLR